MITTSTFFFLITMASRRLDVKKDSNLSPLIRWSKHCSKMITRYNLSCDAKTRYIFLELNTLPHISYLYPYLCASYKLSPPLLSKRLLNLGRRLKLKRRGGTPPSPPLVTDDFHLYFPMKSGIS